MQSPPGEGLRRPQRPPILTSMAGPQLAGCQWRRFSKIAVSHARGRCRGYLQRKLIRIMREELQSSCQSGSPACSLDCQQTYRTRAAQAAVTVVSSRAEVECKEGQRDLDHGVISGSEARAHLRVSCCVGFALEASFPLSLPGAVAPRRGPIRADVTGSAINLHAQPQADFVLLPHPYSWSMRAWINFSHRNPPNVESTCSRAKDVGRPLLTTCRICHPSTAASLQTSS
jgi:hypothetical protein